MRTETWKWKKILRSENLSWEGGRQQDFISSGRQDRQASVSRNSLVQSAEIRAIGVYWLMACEDRSAEGPAIVPSSVFVRVSAIGYTANRKITCSGSRCLLEAIMMQINET